MGRSEERLLVKIALGIFAFFAFGMLYAYMDSENTKEKLYPLVKEKWTAWEDYRTKHCVLVEQSYGLAAKSGKNTFHDNALTYQCGTMKYVVTERIIDWAKECVGVNQKCYYEENLQYIPKVPVNTHVLVQ